jgi:HSP20 family protein
MDASETPSAILIKLDVPAGTKQDDLRVKIEDGILILSGERKGKRQHKEGTCRGHQI